MCQSVSEASRRDCETTEDTHKSCRVYSISSIDTGNTDTRVSAYLYIHVHWFDKPVWLWPINGIKPESDQARRKICGLENTPPLRARMLPQSYQQDPCGK